MSKRGEKGRNVRTKALASNYYNANDSFGSIYDATHIHAHSMDFFFEDKREKEKDSAYFTEIDLQNLVAYQIQKECDKSISSHILYKYIRSSEGDVVEVL